MSFRVLRHLDLNKRLVLGRAGLRSIGAITPLTAPSERNDDVTDGGASSMRNTTDVDMDISSGATGRVPPGGTTARLADEMTMGYSKIWERGAHPAWGAEAVEEDSVAEEAEAPEDDEPVAQVPAVQAQRERWGIVPGQDDTLDIDLEVNGAAAVSEVVQSKGLAGPPRLASHFGDGVLVLCSTAPDGRCHLAACVRHGGWHG